MHGDKSDEMWRVNGRKDDSLAVIELFLSKIELPYNVPTGVGNPSCQFELHC